jgi:hypothetical protein
VEIKNKKLSICVLELESLNLQPGDLLWPNRNSHPTSLVEELEKMKFENYNLTLRSTQGFHFWVEGHLPCKTYKIHKGNCTISECPPKNSFLL